MNMNMNHDIYYVVEEDCCLKFLKGGSQAIYLKLGTTNNWDQNLIGDKV